MNKNYIPLLMLIVGILVIGALFIAHSYQASRVGAPATTATSTIATSTSGITVGSVSATGNPTVTITQGASSSGVPVAPSLNRSMTFSPSLSADVVANLKTQEAANIASLKANPNQGDAWLQLGVDYKIAGDYAGAEAVWIYLTKIAPTSYIAYADLGDLYTNFLQNYPKAEADYKEVIALQPDYIDAYRSLYYLYGMEHNPSAQSAILAEGLKANPNNPDLLQLQQQMQTQ